ncbi:MAG: hypothetical protein PHQ27_04835, partial [Victivallales bacterium]|nr:hypothetical protein [Victivallales bacterium]
IMMAAGSGVPAENSADALWKQKQQLLDDFFPDLTTASRRTVLLEDESLLQNGLFQLVRNLADENERRGIPAQPEQWHLAADPSCLYGLGCLYGDYLAHLAAQKRWDEFGARARDILVLLASYSGAREAAQRVVVEQLLLAANSGELPPAVTVRLRELVHNYVITSNRAWMQAEKEKSHPSIVMAFYHDGTAVACFFLYRTRESEKRDRLQELRKKYSELDVAGEEETHGSAFTFYSPYFKADLALWPDRGLKVTPVKTIEPGIKRCFQVKVNGVDRQFYLPEDIFSSQALAVNVLRTIVADRCDEFDLDASDAELTALAAELAAGNEKLKLDGDALQDLVIRNFYILALRDKCRATPQEIETLRQAWGRRGIELPPSVAARTVMRGKMAALWHKFLQRRTPGDFSGDISSLRNYLFDLARDVPQQDIPGPIKAWYDKMKKENRLSSFVTWLSQP